MARPKMTEEQRAQAAAERAAKAAQVDASPTAEPEQELPTLADYIAAHERDGIVLVRVTYPGAEPHVFPAKYSGVTVADGPLSCIYADGSTQ